MMKITLRLDCQNISAMGVVTDKHLYAQFEWKMHERLDLLAHREMVQSGYQCIAVELSGEERAWVGRTFTGLPRLEVNALADTLKYRGDFASFIYDHLPRSIRVSSLGEPRQLNSFPL